MHPILQKEQREERLASCVLAHQKPDIVEAEKSLLWEICDALEDVVPVPAML